MRAVKVLVDTGPLVAFLNRRDRYHAWAKQQLVKLKPPLLTCEAVVSEACFLLRAQPGGAEAVLELLERELLEITFDLGEEASRIRDVIARYANLPASLADACLVRMAELHAGSRVLTLDSHYKIYRIHGRKVIPTISPDEDA
ncbi:MAG TPA: PIN domain-containing protein [Thermoanaerobaculia bacterium]